MMQENLNNIIESLLFVSEEPLTVDKFKQILETVDAKEIRASLQSLVEAYEARGGGFKLAEVAGGWQLRSRPEYNKWLKRMLQPSPQRLSKAALETLAIIAYNQPIIRVDIEHIRGVDAGGVLRQLLERKLIRVLGRKEIPGRPIIYATTKLFLELFELKDLKDLPSPKEIEEMSAVAEPEPTPPIPEIENATTSGTADTETADQPEPLYEETKSYRVTSVVRHMTPSKHPKRTSTSTTSPIIQGHESIISSTPFKLPKERWKISIRPNSLKKP
jgi:segregation and condensation protein B